MWLYCYVRNFPACNMKEMLAFNCISKEYVISNTVIVLNIYSIKYVALHDVGWLARYTDDMDT